MSGLRYTNFEVLGLGFGCKNFWVLGLGTIPNPIRHFGLGLGGSWVWV